MTRVYEIDPLQDERWNDFVARHPRATVFHTTPWLIALQRTYGFQAVAFTTSTPTQNLVNAILLCRVKSWLTGRRLVSLPFSDHCAALVDHEEELGRLLAQLKHEWRQTRERYVELRSGSCPALFAAGWAESASFCLHRLNLHPSETELLQGLHPSCIRRKIAKAQQVDLKYEEGRSEELLKQFYQLAILTRRRQEIPPQPIRWFRNLIASFGEDLKIRVASYEGHLAAAILTLRHRDTMTYKYGCSDARFLNQGPMQFLLWKAILEAKHEGFAEFDMGRSEWSNSGLIAFKDRWGATRYSLTYYRYPPVPFRRSSESKAERMMKRICGLPAGRLLTAAGSLMYRHIA